MDIKSVFIKFWGVWILSKRVINVLRVISKNINQLNKNRILELLTIETKFLNNSNYEISLIFSGDSTITIITENIDIILDDQGIPWEAKSFPKHKI